MDKQIVSVGLPEQLVEKIDIIALSKKTSRSGVIETAVNQLVNDNYKDAKKRVRAMLEEK